MRRIQYLIILCLLIASCVDEDMPVNAPLPYIVKVDINSGSQSRSYISLKNKNNTATSSDSLWHLKFQNAKNNWAVFLNPLLDIGLCRIATTNFEAVNYSYISGGVDWLRDVPLSNAIYPAIGTWGDFNFDRPKSFKTVYGLRINGTTGVNFLKFQLLDATDGNYHIRYARMDGSADTTITVSKKPDYEHSYISLSFPATEHNIEPPSDLWELCFGYSLDSVQRHFNSYPEHFISNELAVYHLIIANKNKVKIAEVNNTAFEDIDFFLARKLQFESYEQLPNTLIRYDHSSHNYTINEQTTWVVKKEESYYKVKALTVNRLADSSLSLGIKVQNL